MLPHPLQDFGPLREAGERQAKEVPAADAGVFADCPGFVADGREMGFDIVGWDFAVVFEEDAEGLGDGRRARDEVGEDCRFVDRGKDGGFFVVFVS